MEDINAKIETEVEELDSLTENQKKILYKSLEQADAGLGASLKVINERLRLKYGLNGAKS
ncbi:MAG: hypothetical protein ABIN13_06840 [Mucilaginibacter sp.]